MTPGRRPAAPPPVGAAPEAKRPQAAAAAEARHANTQRRKPGDTDEQLRQRLYRSEYKRLMAQAKRSTAAAAAAYTVAIGSPVGSRAGPSPLRPLAPSGPGFGLFGLLSPPSLPADAIAPSSFALAAPLHPPSGGLLAYDGLLPPPADYVRPPPPAEYRRAPPTGVAYAGAAVYYVASAPTGAANCSGIPPPPIGPPPPAPVGLQVAEAQSLAGYPRAGSRDSTAATRLPRLAPRPSCRT